MNRNEAFPSRYFRAADFERGPLVRTIESVEWEKMQDGERKPVCNFVGETRGLVLNVTNFDIITNLAKSDETKDWPGLKVELYASTAAFAGKDVPAIRVRGVTSRAAPKPAQEDFSNNENPAHGMDTDPWDYEDHPRS
jgi:hypothetical protein